MENSAVNVARPEIKISSLSSKDMKKQDSLRCYLVSGFLVVVEMMHALQCLWESLLPFALLWWNVMLCATCAKYYSWNRGFRFLWGGHPFHGKAMRVSDVKEIGDRFHGEMMRIPDVGVSEEMCARPFYQPSEDAYLGELQEMELGSCLIQQSQPSSLQDLDDGVSVHDAHVDAVVICVEPNSDYHVKKLKSKALIMSVSKTVDITIPSGTSQMSCLHFFDEKRFQRPGLLKASYWEACSYLLPQQLAPLAVYGSSVSCLVYLWMHPTLQKSAKFMDVKATEQLLDSIYVKFSTLQEPFHVYARDAVSSLLSMVNSKDRAFLTRTIAMHLTSRGYIVDANIMQFASLCLDEFEQSSLPFSDLESQSNVGLMEDGDEDYDSDEKERVCSILRHSYDDYTLKFVGGSRSDTDSNDGYAAIQSREMDCPGHSRSADDEANIIGSGEEMGWFHESSIYLNDSSCAQSAEWDARHGDSHWLQDVGSVYGGYYNAADGVLPDYTYFDGSSKNDDDWSYDDTVPVYGHPTEARQRHLSETWWDDDAVLVGMQESEEDSMEEVWQVM